MSGKIWKQLHFFWYFACSLFCTDCVFTDSIVPSLLSNLFIHIYSLTISYLLIRISNKVILCSPLNYLNIGQWRHQKSLQLRCIRLLSAVAWGDQTNITVSLEEIESLPWSLGQKRQRQWLLCGRDILPQEICNLHPQTHRFKRECIINEALLFHKL